MAIIPGTLCGTVTGFALSTLAIISSPGEIRNEGTRKNCISAEMSENGRESYTLYENEERNKIEDLSCFSGVLSYDTGQEADIISAWILKNIRRRERHDYIKRKTLREVISPDQFNLASPEMEKRMPSYPGLFVGKLSKMQEKAEWKSTLL